MHFKPIDRFYNARCVTVQLTVCDSVKDQSIPIVIHRISLCISLHSQILNQSLIRYWVFKLLKFASTIAWDQAQFSFRFASCNNIPAGKAKRRARSIQPKFPEISVQNSMDRFCPTGKVSKKQVHLLRWSSFPGRTGLNFGWMDRARKQSLIQTRA